MLVRNEKKCSTCKCIKPVSEFWKNRSRPDGLQNECKDCQNKRIDDKKSKNKVVENKEVKRNTQLKRLSNYHLNHGLNYKLKYGSNEVTFNCLHCGKKVTMTLDDAWECKYNCCNKKGELQKACDEFDKLHLKYNFDEELLAALQEYKKYLDSLPQWSTIEFIIEKPSIHYEKDTESCTCSSCSEHKEEPIKKQNRFIAWLKKIFHH